MQVGGLVAIASPVFITLLTTKNLLRSIITGLFLRIATDGQHDSPFNVLIMSPFVWKATKITVPIGCAISTISFLGFCYAEGRLPTRRDFNQT